jgi:integrase
VPNKTELREFYACIEKQRDKALFLFYASSGLRRREALTLEIEDVDFESKVVKPKPHNGQTKFTWITFFNSETEQVLSDYLLNRQYKRSRLFPIGREYEGHMWSEAREKTGLKIAPKRALSVL